MEKETYEELKQWFEREALQGRATFEIFISYRGIEYTVVNVATNYLHSVLCPFVDEENMYLALRSVQRAYLGEQNNVIYS